MIKRSDSYDIYEVKYLKDHLSIRAMNDEIAKIKAIEGLKAGRIGFISASDLEGIDQLTGYDLYDPDL